MEFTQKSETKSAAEPELFSYVDKDKLTPEWHELAYLIDETFDDNGLTLVERHSALPEFAEQSSETARSFANFETYSIGDSESIAEFRTTLRRHVNLYYGLSGIHDTYEAKDSMLLLAKNLNAYKKHYEYLRRTGHSSLNEDKSYRRLTASIYEEVGRNEGDVDMLKRAVKINQEVTRDKTISYYKRYKLHAVFSNLDIADYLHGNPTAQEKLGLPTTPEEVQLAFYQQLENYCKALIAENEATEGSRSRESDNIEGILAEIVFLGYMRGYAISRGSYDSVGFTQSAPHHDTYTGLPKVNIPSSSYDIYCYDRETESRVMFDVKKGTGSTTKMPIIQTVKLNLNGYRKIDFIELIEQYSKIMIKHWQGETISFQEQAIVDEVRDKLDIEKMRDKSRSKLGRAVLMLINESDQAIELNT